MENSAVNWCDTSVTPLAGCAGCPLFPSASQIADEMDLAFARHNTGWKRGRCRETWQACIDEAHGRIEHPLPGHTDKWRTTNLWHNRERFFGVIGELLGNVAALEASVILRRSVACYAAVLHLARGRSIDRPTRGLVKGYALNFEELTPFPGRVAAVAALKDLSGQDRADAPWRNGLPRIVFLSAMGDAFSRQSDCAFVRDDVIPAINSAKGRRHIFVWLTKRPARMAKFAAGIGGLPENVCATTTLLGPENVPMLEALKRVPAAMRALSIEPLRAAIDPATLDLSGIDLVILGGESGSPQARPCDLQWILEIRDHCAATGTACFVKQLGRNPSLDGKIFKPADPHGEDWTHWPSDLRVRQYPECFHAYGRRSLGIPTTSNL